MGETIRLQVDFPADEIGAIDRWRTAQGIGRREDAVRRLVRLGLSVAGGTDAETEPEAAPD